MLKEINFGCKSCEILGEVFDILVPNLESGSKGKEMTPETIGARHVVFRSPDGESDRPTPPFTQLLRIRSTAKMHTKFTPLNIITTIALLNFNSL
jgi:hypothetical protein